MDDEPDIIKELREAEKLGILQNKVQSAYEELEKPEGSSEGLPDKTVGFTEDFKDISERTQVEERLREREERYRDLFENINDMVQAVTPDGSFLYVNNAWRKIMGYTQDEIDNLSVFDVVHPDSKKHCMKLFKRIMSGESIKRVEAFFVTKNGKKIAVEGSINCCFRDGKPIVTRGIFRDVTDRKKAEDEIKYLKEYNENILESNPNPMIVIKGNQIEYVNKSFISTFGKTRNDYISKKLKEVIPAFEKLLQDQNKMKELEVKGKSFSVSSFVVKKAEEEEEERMGLVLQDITKRKQAEKDLQERVKELKCLYGIASITERPGITLDELYLEVANLLPLSMQYPESVCARIIIDNLKFKTENFKETEWKQSADLKVYGAIAGVVEVFYLEQKPDSDEGPFLKEERLLIEAIAERLGRITERMQAEEKLKENEEKLRSIVETTSDWIWEVDKNGIYTYVSPKVKDLLGCSPSEVIGKTLFDLMSKDEVERVSSAFLDCIKSNKPIIGLENTNLHKDGRRVILETSGVPFLDGNGNLLGYRGIDRDITERKKAEMKIKLAHEELNQIFNTAADGMRVIDKDFNTLRINKSLSNMIGINKDEAIGKKCYEIFFGPLCHTPACPLTRIIKGAKHVESDVEKERKDGTKISCILTAIPFKGIDGELLGIVEDFKDITQWKKAEEKFKILFDSSRDAIMTLDPPSWKFTSANPSTVELFKAKEESEFTSKGPWDVSPEFQPDGTSSSDKAKKMIGKAMKEGSNFFEWTHKTLDGKEFPATVLLTRVETEEGKPFLQATVRDATEQKNAEKALQESTKRYRELIEGSHDGYLMTDMDGKIIECNSIFKKMTGYTDEEVHQKTHKDITPQEWHSKETEIIKDQVLNRGYSNVFEKELIGKDGRVIDVELRTYLLKQKDKPQGMWSFVRDITDRKQTEDELMSKISDLERYKNITVGRELRIIELKEKVKKLEQKLEKKSE